MRLFWGALLIFLSISAAAVENGKIITDIDGTLRRTNVRAQGLEVFGLIWQAFVGNNYFSGMPELLHALSGAEQGACFGEGEDSAESYTVSYVTSAPVHIKFIGRRFLRKSCFPQGSFHARPYLFGGSREHKFDSIMTLIEESGSQNILLFGDNGEHDIEIYNSVAQNVSGAQLDVFIHMVYSAPRGKELLPGQRPFLTAADLSAQLYELGWISMETFESIVDVVHQDLTDGEQASYERIFPKWMDCTDFITAFRWPVLDLSPETMTKVIEIDQAMGERCFRGDLVPIHSAAYTVESPSYSEGALQCAEMLL